MDVSLTHAGKGVPGVTIGNLQLAALVLSYEFSGFALMV